VNAIKGFTRWKLSATGRYFHTQHTTVH
jgi:hypothetical protein